MTHLHWSKDPKLLHGVIKAIAICGAKDLPRNEVSAFRDDVTCRKCLERDAGEIKCVSA